MQPWRGSDSEDVPPSPRRDVDLTLDFGMGEDIAKLALTVPKDATLLAARIVPRQHWPIPQGLPACFFSR